jgi:hypothetical protein
MRQLAREQISTLGRGEDITSSGVGHIHNALVVPTCLMKDKPD